MIHNRQILNKTPLRIKHFNKQVTENRTIRVSCKSMKMFLVRRNKRTYHIPDLQNCNRMFLREQLIQFTFSKETTYSLQNKLYLQIEFFSYSLK